MAKPSALKIRVIEEIKAGKTRAKVARDYGISTRTVYRWLKKYQKEGMPGLTKPKTYRPPWNISSQEVMEKVYLMKEHNPQITLFETRRKLFKQRINLSLEAIRKIWQRYGLGGYDRKKQSAGIMPRISLSRDVGEKIGKAKTLIDTNNTKEAVEILNSLPYCGDEGVLGGIPYECLSLRRKLEKLMLLSDKEPLEKYYGMAHSLRRALEKEGLFYSSLRAGLMEANALFWLGKTKALLKLAKHLGKRMPIKGDPLLRFNFNLLKGIALARILNLKGALYCANECQRLTKKFCDGSFYIGLGNLYSNIGLYLKARECYERAMGNISSSLRDFCLISLAGCYNLNGEYEKALRVLKEVGDKGAPLYTFIPLARAQAFFGLGRLMEAAEESRRAIEIAKRNEVIQYLHSSTMLLSAIHYSICEEKQAISLIKDMIPLLKKNRMLQDYYIRRLYISKNGIFIPERYRTEPFIRLILLMKNAQRKARLKDYNQALNFAIKKGLKGYFQRLCIFYPDLILKLLKRRRRFGLSGAILSLPVFNKESHVFNVKFLGKIVVAKAGERIKIRLLPKDMAFLVQMALNKNRQLLLDDVYRNFWPRSKNPAKNLAHLLARVRKNLGLSLHLLRIQEDILCWQIYFTTDYQEFEQTLARAKALQRADEWGFARKEYLRAFKLFRGEPFKKNFDNWSVDMRFRILTQLETETINFAKSCLAHGNKRDARKILQKVLKIIPESEEIEVLVKSFNNSV